MAENSKIEWCHHTFNPWRGCTKVSPGCANCYAETMSHRNPKTLGMWGPNGTRVVASEAMWREPLKWNRKAKEAGERHRVFCASLADVFEGRNTMPDGAWADVEAARCRLFAFIDATQNLDWLLLTKRPENIARMMPGYLCSTCLENAHWTNSGVRGLVFCKDGQCIRPNVWLGTSVENREHGLPRLDILRGIPAAVRFLSIEPLLEDLGTIDLTGIHWVIVGGESGTDARPCDVEWIRSIVQQCKDAGVPCFVKQLGQNCIDIQAALGRGNWPDMTEICALSGRVRLNDRKGSMPAEWPEDLLVRELPEAATRQPTGVSGLFVQGEATEG